jgi:chromosome segregation ATPase
MQEHKRGLLLLKSSNNRISHELRTAEKEHEEIKESIAGAGKLVSTLEKMDRLKIELRKLRTANVQMNVIVASLSTKINELEEDLFGLRKDGERVQKHHSEILKKRNELMNLRSKIMPAPKLLEVKRKLSKALTDLEKTSEERTLKNDLPLLIEARDGFREELEKTIERIPVTRERITSTKEKIARIAPKVVSEEEVKRLEDEVRPLRPRKAALAKQSKEISPRVASIAEEEEKMPSILEEYRLKNQQDKDRLSELKKELKELDIDKEALDKLREKVSSVEGEYEVKKKELEKLKEDYSELLSANQKYKAIVEEVEKGTESLKELMDK